MNPKPVCLQRLLYSPHLVACVLSIALSHPTAATDTPVIGGSGGVYFRSACPAGAYLIGLKGFTGNWIDRIAHICAPWHPAKNAFEWASLHGEFIGTSPGGRFEQQTCGGDRAIVSWTFWNTVGEGSQRQFVSSINGTCVNAITRLGAYEFQFGQPETKPKLYSGIGKRGRPDGKSECAPGELAIGFHGRAGLFLDAIGLVCGPAPLKAGYAPPSQAGNMTSAKPPAPIHSSPSQAGQSTSALSTAPKILSPVPAARIITTRSKIQIVPQQYFTGTHMLVYFIKFNAPGVLNEQFAWTRPTSDLTKGLDLPNDIFTANRAGSWSVRARIDSPKAGDFSPEVPFTFAPVTTTKANTPLQLQR